MLLEATRGRFLNLECERRELVSSQPFVQATCDRRHEWQPRFVSEFVWFLSLFAAVVALFDRNQIRSRQLVGIVDAAVFGIVNKRHVDSVAFGVDEFGHELGMKIAVGICCCCFVVTHRA